MAVRISEAAPDNSWTVADSSSAAAPNWPASRAMFPLLCRSSARAARASAVRAALVQRNALLLHGALRLGCGSRLLGRGARHALRPDLRFGGRRIRLDGGGQDLLAALHHHLQGGARLLQLGGNSASLVGVLDRVVRGFTEPRSNRADVLQ